MSSVICPLMFEAFRKFLSEVVDGGKHPAQLEPGDYRLAAAALLVHTAAIDGDISEAKALKVKMVLTGEGTGLRHVVEGEINLG